MPELVQGEGSQAGTDIKVQHLWYSLKEKRTVSLRGVRT